MQSKFTMTRLRHATALATAVALGIMPSASPAAAPRIHRSIPSIGPVGVQRPVGDLLLSEGRGQLINLPAPMSDVFVSNDKVADVQVRSATQLYVFAKSKGEATVYATTKGGQVVYSTNVRVGSNANSLDQMLRLAMPDASITATSMNGLVLLTGTVAGPADSAEAERLVQAFVGADTQVITRLKSATPLQVNLQVKIAEVSRALVKEIGANLLTRDTTGGFQFNIAQGRNFTSITNFDTSNFIKLDASASLGLPPGTISLPFSPKTGFVFPGGTSADFKNLALGAGKTSLGFLGKLFGLDVASALDLAENDGLVATLAQPNLTALSGETASFLAGGEFPVPVSQQLGTISVEYKQYGVSLAFTPTVLADGRISMRVRPEVSELSSDGAVTLNGFSIPAVTTRRAETTIELGSGQSFVIGGLMRNSNTNSIDKAPGLGDVPVLGALFRSNRFRRSETELMIIVTPYLVKPVSANQIKLPTDGYLAPTDAERLLLGQSFGGHSGEGRPVPTMSAPTTVMHGTGAAAPVPAPGPAARGSKTPVSGIAAPGFSQ